MDKYILKSDDKAVIKAALQLFQDLGYKLGDCDRSGMVYAKDGNVECDRLEFWSYYSDQEGCKELTLPQLRDLVVLHRNDVKDATHADNYHDGSLRFFMTSDRDVYVYETNGFQRGWISSGIYPKELKPIQPEPEQGLISGADAKLAWAKGQDVQLECHDGTFHTITHNLSLSIFDDERIKFRLKPCTIKLELEIPAPFEPKDGEEAWCLDGLTLNGYKKIIGDIFVDPGIGFWRTEEEIKQVVAALRGIKG